MQAIFLNSIFEERPAMETVILTGTILGGLGLFLLAIGMMTDSLKLAAGPSLRTLLSEWSKTPLRGIFSGYFITAVVQSSSAVTVAPLWDNIK